MVDAEMADVAQAEAKKNEGNAAFKRQDFTSAIQLYTEALNI